MPRVGEYVELDLSSDNYHTQEYEVRSVTYCDDLRTAVLNVTLM